MKQFTQSFKFLSTKIVLSFIAAALSIIATPALTQAQETAKTMPLRQWPIEWQECKESPSFQCGSTFVPLNWRAPQNQKKISIGLMKLPAHTSSASKGTLIVNLGGPGTTLDGFARLTNEFDDLRKQFDIVAFDPRGFGKSNGITCPTSVPDIGMFQTNPLGEWNNQKNLNSQFFAACQSNAGEVAHYLDSWQVAHDIDAIRQALGQKKLHYFGTSYGTVYGQVYASQFPDKVERMFLDSVVDHTEPSFAARKMPVASQVKNILPRINEWCNTTPSCALHGQNVLSVWDDIQRIAAHNPIPAAGTSQKLTAAMLRNTGLLLTNEGAWPFITAALAQAKAGNASLLLSAMAAQYPNDLLAHARCSDFNAPSLMQTAAAMTTLKRIEPRFMWQIAVGTDAWCIGKRATYPPRQLAVKSIAPILLTNGLYDTGTAPSEGKNVARQLPDSRWFGVEGYHSVYLFGRNNCTRQIVHHYFETGITPKEDFTCKKEG